MSNLVYPNKQLGDKQKSKRLHVRYNDIKLKINTRCEKCVFQTNKPTKNFENLRSLYQHLLYHHSGADKTEYPGRDECIERLQVLSDLINLGVLR